MKSKLHNITKASLTAAALLGLATASLTWAGVLPAQSHAFGQTYAEWNVAWWQWYLGLPPVSATGVTHPAIDDPHFDVTEGQSGHVWFLAAPFPGTYARSITIPTGTALFIETLTSEWSSLEGFPTEQDQRAAATLFANHIVDPFFTIDGVPVKNIGKFRVPTPQFTFTAPTPWIFGDTGGTGTAVAEGYCFLVNPLSVGEHTIHYGGAFHFAIAEGDDFDLDQSLDMTYNITVQP
jgi:hypothetical protein